MKQTWSVLDETNITKKIIAHSYARQLHSNIYRIIPDSQKKVSKQTTTPIIASTTCTGDIIEIEYQLTMTILYAVPLLAFMVIIVGRYYLYWSAVYYIIILRTRFRVMFLSWYRVSRTVRAYIYSTTPIVCLPIILLVLPTILVIESRLFVAGDGCTALW